jgi:hypothetical protein
MERFSGQNVGLVTVRLRFGGGNKLALLRIAIWKYLMASMALCDSCIDIWRYMKYGERHLAVAPGIVDRLRRSRAILKSAPHHNAARQMHGCLA